jgi:hypothetical protein
LRKSLASLCRPSNAGSSGAEKQGRSRQDRAPVLLPGRVQLLRKLYLPSLGQTPTSPSKSTNTSSKKPTACRSLLPASAGRSSGLVCHSKKDTLCLRAQRARARALARTGRANRPKAACFCGRMRNPYLHDSPLRAGSQRRASVRQCAQKPRQEHNPFGKHVVGGDGRGDGRGGIYQPRRSLRRTLRGFWLLRSSPGRWSSWTTLAPTRARRCVS